MVRKVLVQSCEDSNENLLHTMFAIDDNGRKSVGTVIQTGDGLYPATNQNAQKMLQGNLVHKYTTTTSDPQQFLKNADAAVKQHRVSDNRQIIERSTPDEVWEKVGASFSVAAVIAAGFLTGAQQYTMIQEFMADGVLSPSEIVSLGFNAFEGVPEAFVDVAQAACGDGPFVQDLLDADNGAGVVEHGVGVVAEKVVGWFSEIF